MGSLYVPWAFKWVAGPLDEAFSSDCFGWRRVHAVLVFLTVVPTLWLAWTMHDAQWIMPIDVNAEGRPLPSTTLVATFWAAVLVLNVFHGLFYGVHSALFMGVTSPAVAATQFTAYMAMTNFAITYTAWWQGLSIERWGYPATLVLDAAFGLVGLALLPLMKPVRDAAASRGP